MAEHKISWLNMPGYQPETWNPIVGCNKISPGCDNCFAERMAFRIAQMQLKNQGKNGYHYTEVSKLTSIGWTGETRLVKEALKKPLQWKSPRMVFTVDMGDLFHESVPFEWIDQVFDIIYDCIEHIFIILTKRPERMKEYMDYRIKSHKYYGHSWVWLGVTAENQEQANKRIPILLQIPTDNRIVSIEPMLGPVDLTRIYHFTDHLENVYYRDVLNEKSFLGARLDITNYPGKLDWVICGGESGPKARPLHPDWVRSVRDQCASANVPFFFKQWGEWMPFSGSGLSHMRVLDKNYTTRVLTFSDDSKLVTKAKCEVLPYTETYKVGRKAAGDMLDGVQHHEWPKL